MSRWIEDSGTMGGDRLYRWGEHSSLDAMHMFRWVDGMGHPLSEWVPCTDCFREVES
jgi:hypothetical protein